MSGETSLKFIIPESSCQKAFEVWALFADGAKESVLRCDWAESKYYCDSAPGYTHTLENSTALITVPRDLDKKPDDFICESLFRPKTDPSRCLCKRAAITPVQPDSDSPWSDDLKASVVVIASLLLVIAIMMAVLIYRCCSRRTSSQSKRHPNVRPDEHEPSKVNAPLISATDSQKSSTATVIYFSCGAVQLIKKPTDPNSRPKPPRPFKPPPETAETLIQNSPAIEESRLDVPQVSATDSQKSSMQTVICVSCGAVNLIKMPTSQTSEPSMDVPQMSAADLQESSTPAVTPPPTETVPPKKETKLGRNKTHP